MHRPHLHKDWKQILTKAWSVRLMIIAGIFSGCEVIIPLFQESLPQGLFAVLSFLSVSGGFVMRLVAQQNMSEEIK